MLMHNVPIIFALPSLKDRNVIIVLKLENLTVYKLTDKLITFCSLAGVFHSLVLVLQCHQSPLGIFLVGNLQ